VWQFTKIFLAASPFVIAIQIAGIGVLPDIVNAGLLVFVLSSASSGKKIFLTAFPHIQYIDYLILRYLLRISHYFRACKRWTSTCNICQDDAQWCPSVRCCSCLDLFRSRVYEYQHLCRNSFRISRQLGHCICAAQLAQYLAILL